MEEIINKIIDGSTLHGNTEVGNTNNRMLYCRQTYDNTFIILTSTQPLTLICKNKCQNINTSSS